MLCQDIYDTALRFIAEPGASPASDADYRTRAPYLLSAVCHEMGALDRETRRSQGLGVAAMPGGFSLPLTTAFPLCDRLGPAASYYLASALVFDENPELSDRLFSRYSGSVAGIYREIPATVGSTRDVYSAEE